MLMKMPRFARSLFQPLTLAALLAMAVLSVSPLAAIQEQDELGRLPDEEAELSPRPRATVDAPAATPWRDGGLEEGPLPEAVFREMKERARTAAGLPLAQEPFPGATAREAQLRARPAIVSRFDGLDRSESGGSFPPDTSLAVGPDTILQAVNTAARLTTRDGAELDASSLFDFFGVVPTHLLSDPKVQFDPFSERYFMVILEIDFDSEEAWFHLALSRGEAPSTLAADQWCNYRYSTVRRGAWGDYPGLGMNERWMAVSTNNFAFSGGFVESRLFVIDKSKAQGELASCPKLKMFAFNPNPDSGGYVAFNPQPAQHYDATGEKDSPLYAVGSNIASLVAGDGGYTIFRIAGKGRRPRLSSQEVMAEPYTVPPDAEQPGGLTLDSGDFRVMQQATYRDGQLWFAHSTACQVKGSPQGLACVRVTGLRPAAEGGPAIDFQATLGKKKEYLFWPGVLVTEDGDVVVAALRSGPNRFLETAVFGMAKGAARFAELVSIPRAPRFGKARTTEPGACTPINVSTTTDGESIARSGDYVGLALDPESDDLWVSGEHGKFGLGGGCIWGTDVVRVRF